MEGVIGGTLAQDPQTYSDRSPSRHLDGLAQAVRQGMSFVDIWSVSPHEQHEFNGATCSVTANAEWLQQLAVLLGRPVDGYVTELQHGHSLWDYGRSVLALAGLGTISRPLPGRRVVFTRGGPIPTDSVCAQGTTFLDAAPSTLPLTPP